MRPDRDGPLSAHIEDQLANGPGYVQWNIALYEDHILYVVPGSHRRLSTEIESSHLQGERGTTSPVPESRPVELGPGDGVVYNNLMLHWGSKYGPEAKRRTVHLGYRSFGRTFPRQQCNLPMGFWNRFAEPGPRSGGWSNTGSDSFKRNLRPSKRPSAQPCRETRKGFGPD